MSICAAILRLICSRHSDATFLNRHSRAACVVGASARYNHGVLLAGANGNPVILSNQAFEQNPSTSLRYAQGERGIFQWIKNQKSVHPERSETKSKDSARTVNDIFLHQK
ncbi:MAG: hypothetical protein HOO95_04720 [Gallionella sp.]|nr:hypothetical protein [Gallionella sp.]